MTTLAHRTPAARPVIVQVNIDITPLFWPLYAVVWLSWLTLGRSVRLVRQIGALGRIEVIAPFLAYLRGWLADLSLMAEAARLLFMKDVSYGTFQA